MPVEFSDPATLVRNIVSWKNINAEAQDRAENDVVGVAGHCPTV
jgi:hypothetical protein